MVPVERSDLWNNVVHVTGGQRTDRRLAARIRAMAPEARLESILRMILASPLDASGRRRRAMIVPMTKDGWEMEHSPYTPEGSVESAGKFARAVSARRGSPEVRRFKILIIASLIGLPVLAIVGALVTR